MYKGNILLFLLVIIIILYYIKLENNNYAPKIGMSYIPKNNHFKYFNINQSSYEFNIAIVSSFFNYHNNNIISFIKCLDNVKFKGHIVIFTNNILFHNFSNPIIHQIIINDLHPYYSLKNIEFPIDLNILYKSIPKNCNWNIRRYYLYNIWLTYYHFLFSFFYFCDGRDVIFQLNPSKWNFGKGVHLTLQSDKVSIKESNVNIIWTKKFKMRDSIFQQYVINGGTIFGSSTEITSFISQMIYMLEYLNLTCNNDQGTLIYYYYSHPTFSYPVYLDKQGYGYSLTLCDLRCDIYFIEYCNYKISINESKIKNLDGTIPIILHGIERWKNTKNKTRKKEYYNYINKYFPYYSSKYS